MSKIRSHAATDVGCVRKNNEDSFCHSSAGADLWIGVADGCGGEAAGEVASALAVSTFESEIKAKRDSGRDIAFVLRDAVVSANRRILDEAKESSKKGMGTTFSAVFFRGTSATLVHVGDSRIYRRRKGRTERLSEDHTWVNDAIKAGQLKKEDAKNHPRASMLTKALGMPEFDSPDMDIIGVEEGDSFLICSDGLYACVAEHEIDPFMDQDPKDGAARLIALARERGAPDNVTIAIAHVEGFQSVA